MSIDHSSPIIFHEKLHFFQITYFQLFLRFAFDTKIFFDIVSKKMFFIIGMTLEARLLLCTTESVVFCFFGFLLCDWRRSCNNVVPLFCIQLVISQRNKCLPKIEKKMPYSRHYKPWLVHFFTPFPKTIYVL